jgi:hypothetical protein
LLLGANPSGLAKLQLLGYAGSLALILGCFSPLVHLPVVGSINYVYNGRGDGMIVLGLAVAVAAMTYFEKYRVAAFTTLAISLVCSFTLVRFVILFSDMRSSLDEGLRGNPFRGFADAMVSAVGLDWGWGLLIIGIVLLLFSSVLSVRQQRLEA